MIFLELGETSVGLQEHLTNYRREMLFTRDRSHFYLHSQGHAGWQPT
jgi:hypothetical protein